MLLSVHQIFGFASDQDLIDRLTWIGFIYTALVGIYSLILPAPYGRYAKSVIFTKLSLNPVVAWMVQESPSAVVPALLFCLTPAKKITQLANAVAITLFVLHYVHRAFIYPQRLSKNTKPVPVLTAASAFVYTVFNGFLQGHHLLNVRQVENSDSFYTVLGSAIFVLGMFVNVFHDYTLCNLRKSTKSGDKKEYQIPYGGLFNYVSGANFLGEMIEWCGFALITRGTPQILFAAFSVTFLGMRGVHHHKFYLETFGDRYPKNRKAIIPFVL